MNPFSGEAKWAARLVIALAAIATLLVAAGCGNSAKILPVNGGFSNSSLNGQYAFTVRGFGILTATTQGSFVEGGVFTADGNGHITAGTHDPSQMNFTGTYGPIRKDGTGDLTFNFGGNVSETFRITLSDTSHLYMVEEDGNGTSSGLAEKQDSTQLSTIPSGTFVARSHDSGLGTSTLARMTVTSGTISGTFNEFTGAEFTGNVTGTFGTPTNGRGTVTYSLGGENHGSTYYVVNANRFLLLDETANSVGSGEAEKQSTITFSSASLSGPYAFGSRGDGAFLDTAHTVGVFTADGATAITSGNYDLVQDGLVSSNVAVTSGSYFISADGSGSLTTGGIQRTLWMVSPSRGYFYVVDAAKLEDGTFDLQSGSFSNSTLNGQSAFFMDGFDTQFKDRVGTLIPDGKGSLATNYVSSFFDPNQAVGGSQLNSFTGGSYSVSANGRVTAQPGFTTNLVLYLVSDSKGYGLQADPNVDIGGAFTVQTGP